MSKVFEIDGCVEVAEDIGEDEFWNIFIDFIKSHGWYFGGGINECIEED